MTPQENGCGGDYVASDLKQNLFRKIVTIALVECLTRDLDEWCSSGQKDLCPWGKNNF